MDRCNDPEITGILHRRIPPNGGKTKWDANGIPTFTKSNFIDRSKELSLRIACETTPEQTLDGYDGFGLAQITAEAIRLICQSQGIFICRDERDPSHGHVLVCGNITEGLAKGLQRVAKWVDGKWPRYIDPVEEAGGIQLN